MGRVFIELIGKSWDAGKFVCVGLDLDTKHAKFPESARVKDDPETTLVNFGFPLVTATSDIVGAYKPNLSFFLAHGASGLLALRRLILHINEAAPDVPVIGDGKWGDIGNTNRGYIQFAFDYLGCDAITVHPYLGLDDGMQLFADQKDKGIFVLARTSNAGAKEFQNLFTLPFNPCVDRQGVSAEEWLQKICGRCQPLYRKVAENVAAKWNVHGNCGVVAGATFPKELKEIRDIVGDVAPILIPAVGKQGGDLEKAVLYGANSQGKGFIINSSRDIIFASSGPDFAKAARLAAAKLRDQINEIKANIISAR